MNSSNRQILNPHDRLRAGCYVVRFTPASPVTGRDKNPLDPFDIREYVGTMRVVHYNNSGNKALTIESGRQGTVVDISGDLYAVTESIPAEIYQETLNVCPAAPIPIFPIENYRFYLLANDIQETERNRFLLSLRSQELFDGDWQDRGVVIADLQWSKAPEGSPSPFDYLEGPVSDESDNRIGTLTLNWVSDYLRRAVLELDRVEKVNLPLNNYEKINPALKPREQRDWTTVFRSCGWYLELPIGDQPADTNSRIWTEPELQRALPALRDAVDPDKEWRYHIFCVGLLDDDGRGYEFDSRGTDAKKSLFESVVLAAKYRFPKDEGWGRLTGKTLDKTPLYFRTAVHEIGHAMKLDHNFSTGGFLSTTDAIQQIAASKKSKGNGKDPDVLAAVSWDFAPDDQERLRHWPDIVVRPAGGGPKLALPGIDEFRFTPLFGGSDDSSPPTNDLRFRADAFYPEVPLGAPVRIELTLTNRGLEDLQVPTLRLKSGNMFGTVELSTNETRQFVPLARSVDSLRLQTLKPGESVTGSLSLLSGPDGPLFPDTGPYTVNVDLSWYSEGKFYNRSASTPVLVLPFIDTKHLKVATRLLRTPETLVSFAIGGDGLPGGDEAINLALNNETLRPHYEVVRLKRLLRGSDRTPASQNEALRILEKEPGRGFVLTQHELNSLAKIIAEKGVKQPDVEHRAQGAGNSILERIKERLLNLGAKFERTGGPKLPTPKEPVGPAPSQIQSISKPHIPGLGNGSRSRSGKKTAANQKRSSHSDGYNHSKLVSPRSRSKRRTERVH